MAYDYSLSNSLNFKRLNSFTGNSNNADFNKQLQDTTTQSAEVARQGLKQNPLGGAAVDTFDNAKENPLVQAGSMGAGLAVSGGFGALYKTATWGTKPTETLWYKFFDKMGQNGIVKQLDKGVNAVGSFIKGITPDFIKKGEISEKFMRGVAEFKGGQQELFGLNKEFLEKATEIIEKSKPEAASSSSAKAIQTFLKANPLSGQIKELGKIEALSKSEIAKKAVELAGNLNNTDVKGLDKALHELKGLANRVQIVNELGHKSQGPIVKALSNTSMFVSKLFAGNTLGIVLNAVFMGQTVKSVMDAKPEDRHKVLAEEIAGTWIGTMLLLPPIEKAFNAVMNFRHIGLKGENLTKMLSAEKALKLIKEAPLRKEAIKKMTELAKKTEGLNFGLKGLKMLGSVLSFGMNRTGPLKFIGAAARVGILWFVIGGKVSDACKGVAHMITGAPPNKEKEVEEKKKAEAKALEMANPAIKQAASAQVNNKPQTAQVNKQAVKEEVAVKLEQKEEEYIPSAIREKKFNVKSGNQKMAGNPQVLSALSKSDAILKQAESMLKG